MPKVYQKAVVEQLDDISRQICKRRETKEVTQEELAEMIGTSTTAIQGIEKGRIRPSIEVLIAIVKALEMKIVIQ